MARPGCLQVSAWAGRTNRLYVHTYRRPLDGDVCAACVRACVRVCMCVTARTYIARNEPTGVSPVASSPAAPCPILYSPPVCRILTGVHTYLYIHCPDAYIPTAHCHIIVVRRATLCPTGSRLAVCGGSRGLLCATRPCCCCFKSPLSLGRSPPPPLPLRSRLGS